MPTPFFSAKLIVRSEVAVGLYVAVATQISSPELAAASAGWRSVYAVPGAQHPVPLGTGLTQRTVAEAAPVAAAQRNTEADRYRRRIERLLLVRRGTPHFRAVLRRCQPSGRGGAPA